MSDATDHEGQAPSSGTEPADSTGSGRPPVHIGGPAHRRPGRRLTRRSVVIWSVVAVLVSVVLVQWCFSVIHERADRTESWSGPPPSWHPSVAVSTVTATPSPTRSPSRSPSIEPTTQPALRPRTHTPEPHATHKAPAGPPTAKITAPKPGTTVAGGPGVQMTGTAHPDGRQLLIFDLAPNGVYYLASDDGPVPVSDGHWSFQDASIGDGSNDVGKDFVLTAVLADGTCQATIHATPRDAQNNIAYPSLPDGCRAADSVRVTKTAP